MILSDLKNMNHCPKCEVKIILPMYATLTSNESFLRKYVCSSPKCPINFSWWTDSLTTFRMGEYRIVIKDALENDDKEISAYPAYQYSNVLEPTFTFYANLNISFHSLYNKIQMLSTFQ